MNGILAQAAALAAHAKVRVLDAQLGGDDAYWATHSTFKYVKTLSFIAQKRRFLKTIATEVATTPTGWMATLPTAGIINLISLGSTGPLPAHVAKAFAGGSQEAITVSLDASSSVWVPAWEPSGERDPEQRGWQVRYTVVEAPPLPMSLTTIQLAREHLKKTLEDITEFAAADPALSPWCETFRKAEAMLDAFTPAAPYHPDILPVGGYTLAARQLLAAAVTGWVFGGMGSWNDEGPTSSAKLPEYERLTRELYSAVTSGLAVAVNDGLDR